MTGRALGARLPASVPPTAEDKVEIVVLRRRRNRVKSKAGPLPARRPCPSWMRCLRVLPRAHWRSFLVEPETVLDGHSEACRRRWQRWRAHRRADHPLGQREPQLGVRARPGRAGHARHQGGCHNGAAHPPVSGRLLAGGRAGPSLVCPGGGHPGGRLLRGRHRVAHPAVRAVRHRGEGPGRARPRADQAPGRSLGGPSGPQLCAQTEDALSRSWCGTVIPRSPPPSTRSPLRGAPALKCPVRPEGQRFRRTMGGDRTTTVHRPPAHLWPLPPRRSPPQLHRPLQP
jgi:hypothetical protein